MAGYNGYSMSNNACDAYACGEKPYNQWLKSDVLDALKYEAEYTQEQLSQIRKYSAETVKTYFLTNTSWHHTSLYYNVTYFYDLNFNKLENEFSKVIEDLERIQEIIKEEKEEKEKNKKTFTLAKVKYLEWYGTRKHPKADEKEAYALIDANRNWAYIYINSYEVKKKSIISNGFKILEEYNRAPKGTAEIYKCIRKNMKK